MKVDVAQRIQWKVVERRQTDISTSFTGLQSRDIMPHMPVSQVDLMDESHLITLAKAGHTDAFGELVQRYQHSVFNLCYRMLGNYQEAEDAAQEVFIKIYRKLHAYNDAYRFSTWVLSVASHHCIDRLRQRHLRYVPLETSEVTRQWDEAATPEEQVISQEDADQIQTLLNRLPQDYRLVLVLHYWYDMSYREIAEILGTTEGATKTKAHRARRQLAQLMREKGERL